MASPEGALLTQKIRMNMEEFKKTCEDADLRGKKAAGIGRERFGNVGGIYNDHGTYKSASMTPKLPDLENIL